MSATTSSRGSRIAGAPAQESEARLKLARQILALAEEQRAQSETIAYWEQALVDEHEELAKHRPMHKPSPHRRLQVTSAVLAQLKPEGAIPDTIAFWEQSWNARLSWRGTGQKRGTNEA